MTISKEYKIGLAVFTAVLILIFGINFLKGKSIFTNDTKYVVYYQKIDGLKVGSYVLMRGYKVGVVEDISFVGETAESIKVTFIINQKLKFSEDSKVRIFSLDLMGTRGLDIMGGTSIKMKNTGDSFEGIIEGSFKDEFGRQIAPLKNKTERLLSSIDSILVSIHGIVNSETEQNIKNSLNSIGKTLSNLESSSMILDNAIKKETTSLSNIMGNVESITGNLKKNNEKISKILSNAALITDTINASGLGKGLKNITESLNNINVLSQKLTTDKTTAGAILNNRELYNNLNETVSNLNRVVLDLEKNPKKYISFSVFGSSKSVSKKASYAIVAIESDTKLIHSNETKDLKEYFYKGKYLYLYKSYRKNTSAKKDLENIKKTYPKAFIQEIK